MRPKEKLARLSDLLVSLAKELGTVHFTVTHWKDCARSTYGQKLSFCWYDWFKSVAYTDTNLARIGSRGSFTSSSDKALAILKQFEEESRGLEQEDFYDKIAVVFQNTVGLKDIIEGSQEMFEHIICPLTSSKDRYKDNPQLRTIVKSIKRAYRKATPPEEYTKYLTAKKGYTAIEITHTQKRDIEDLESKLLGNLRECHDYLMITESETGKKCLKYVKALLATVNNTKTSQALTDAPVLKTTYEPWLASALKLHDQISLASNKDDAIRRAKKFAKLCLTSCADLVSIEKSVAQVQKAKPKYKFYTKYLTPEAQEFLDTWAVSLNTTVNDLFSDASKLSKMGQSIVEEFKPVRSVPPPRSSYPNRDFRSQLQDKSRQLFEQPAVAPEPENPEPVAPTPIDSIEKSNAWTTNQLEILSQLITPRNRLLSDDEEMGILEMSCYIVSGYNSGNPDIRKAFEKSRYETARAMGYTVIKNCLVFGLSTEMVAQFSNKADAIGSCYMKLVASLQNEKIKKKLSRLSPIEPPKSKGKHVYVMLIPTKALYPDNAKEEISFSVKKWDFEAKKDLPHV